MAAQSPNEYQCKVKPIPYDPYAHYARHLIKDEHDSVIPHLIDPHRKLLQELEEGKSITFKHKEVALDPGTVPVGILGAGSGGLYAALILDDLGIKYQILEASGRTGGRMFTHHFSQQEYDYYVSSFSNHTTPSHE